MRSLRSERHAVAGESAGHSSYPAAVKDAVLIMTLAVGFIAGLVLIFTGLL